MHLVTPDSAAAGLGPDGDEIVCDAGANQHDFARVVLAQLRLQHHARVAALDEWRTLAHPHRQQCQPADGRRFAARRAVGGRARHVAHIDSDRFQFLGVTEEHDLPAPRVDSRLDDFTGRRARCEKDRKRHGQGSTQQRVVRIRSALHARVGHQHAAQQVFPVGVLRLPRHLHEAHLLARHGGEDVAIYVGIAAVTDDHARPAAFANAGNRLSEFLCARHGVADRRCKGDIEGDYARAGLLEREQQLRVFCAPALATDRVVECAERTIILLVDVDHAQLVDGSAIHRVTRERQKLAFERRVDADQVQQMHPLRKVDEHSEAKRVERRIDPKSKTWSH